MRALAHRLFPRYDDRDALHFLWAYFGIGIVGAMAIVIVVMRFG
jgi:hypothetical protein